MHGRSIFLFLRLVLNFELNLSPPRSRSESISRRIRAAASGCRHKQLHYPAIKNNNPAYHAFGKYWMQAWWLLNYCLKYCWLKVICCICEPNELAREIKHITGGPNWEQPKIWEGHGPPRPPLESPLDACTGRLRMCYAIDALELAIQRT